jgi:hypothetical protein
MLLKIFAQALQVFYFLDLIARLGSQVHHYGKGGLTPERGAVFLKSVA